MPDNNTYTTESITLRTHSEKIKIQERLSSDTHIDDFKTVNRKNYVKKRKVRRHFKR